MEKNSLVRLETFCDGIFAIAITLLIIEIKVPEFDHIHCAGDLKHELFKEWPSWFAFGLSFITLLIAWSNHHNFFKQLDKITPAFMYANGFLMLTVILFPFPTAVLGRFLNTEFAGTPVMLYCLINIAHNTAWLVVALVALYPKDLSKNEKHSLVTRQSMKAIAGFLLAEIVITVIAIWFPIAALISMTALWFAILLAGIFVTKIED